MQGLEEIRKYMGENIETIKKHLGNDADYLLGFNNPKIKKESLHLPGSDFVDRIFMD